MNPNESSMENAILKAAEELFIEKGFSRTTTAQIAKQAGCNQALVHYYFRTKERLFNQIFEKNARLISSALFSFDAKGGTIEEKITQLVETHFDFFVSHPQLPLFILNELLENQGRVCKQIERIKHFPQSILNKLNEELSVEIKKGNIRPVKTSDLLFSILSLNITPFIITPLLSQLNHCTTQERELFLQQRKAEVVKTILARIRN